jgi:hypothetical protein
MPQALYESSLTSLPLLGRGKVRENYAVGDDRILMVASDRLSAFDVIMGEPIPGKGALLTKMALFWFDKLDGIVPNHLTGDDPLAVVTAAEREQIRDRAMLVKRLKPLPISPAAAGLSTSRARASAASSCPRACAMPTSCPRPSSRPPPRPRWATTTRTSRSSRRRPSLAATSPPACATSPSSSTSAPPTSR